MRWLCVLVATTSVAAAEIPRRTNGIVARSDGAWVLEEDSARLVAVDARGGARDVSHPDVGMLEAIDGDWILGRRGLLRREGGAWEHVALTLLPNTVDPFRRGHVVSVGRDRAVVVRSYGREQPEPTPTPAGTVVDLVDGVNVTHLVTLPDVILSRPVADGRGGFWTIVRKRMGYSGYAHYADGTWRLWRQTMTKTSSYLAELPPMEVRDAGDNAILEQLAYTGDGGALAHWYDAIYRIAADGSLTMLASVEAQKVCAIVPDGAGHLVVATAGLGAISVIAIDARARVAARTPIPLPKWYTSAHFRPPVYDCEASLVDGRLWIASGPFVFERTAAGYTAHVAGAVVAETAADNAAERPHPLAVAVPPLAIAGIGVLGGGALDDDRRYGAAALATVAGSVGGLPAALLLDFLDDSPCITGNDSGYQFLNDAACAARTAGYGVGIAGAGALGGLGTYVVARDHDGANRDAYVGAFAGGSAGAVVSIATTKLMRRYVPKAGSLARSVVAATLIGTGSTIGYQLAR